MSISLRDRELKDLIFQFFLNVTLVDLLVRSWVEISVRVSVPLHLWSTSSRGRELKWYRRLGAPPDDWSTSSWGRELKYQSKSYILRLVCRPLREVVSWNDKLAAELRVIKVDLLVRSRVEMAKRLWLVCLLVPTSSISHQVPATGKTEAWIEILLRGIFPSAWMHSPKCCPLNNRYSSRLS